MRNKLQLTIRLLCMAAFLWIAPGGIGAQDVEWDVWDGSTIATGFAGGSGAQNDPYQISSGAQLAYLAQQVNKDNGNSGSDYSGVFFKLTKNIDLNNEEWTPIGKSFETFKGTFDGNALTIKNLKVNNSSLPDTDQYTGLFGCIENATIEKLTVIISDAGIKGYRVGGITGAARGATTTIKNCCVLGGPMEASVSNGGESAAGGIVGAVLSIIGGENSNLSISFCCANVSSITASLVRDTGSAHTGGIVGYFGPGNTLSVTNCLSLITNMTASTHGSTYSREYGGIIGKDGGSPTLNNNYSNPLCVFTDKTVTDEQETTTTSSPTTGSVNNADGAALTPDNFNASGALAGWEAQGWTLTDGYLPKISPSAPDILSKYILSNAGSESDPYRITSADDLKEIASQVNIGAQSFYSKFLRLENDIDLNNQEWTPIGTEANPFKGTFDGYKHTIRNLKMDKIDENAGLFGVGDNMTIKNLGVVIGEEGIKITAKSKPGHAGGIIAYTKGGTIRSCFVAGGPIKGFSSRMNNFLGGIVGEQKFDPNRKLTINYCYVMVKEITSEITGASNTSSHLGGMNGRLVNSRVEITNCLSLVKALTTKAQLEQGETLDIGSARITNIGTGMTLQNNYSTPFCYILVTGVYYTYVRSEYITNGAVNNQDGANLTKENFNADAGNALVGWADAGWTLHEGQLPTLDPNEPGLPIDQFIISGSGTTGDPYQVRNENDLLYYAYQINKGTSGYNGTEYYKLENDITITSPWAPIGTASNPFKGTFDGNNKTITFGIKADANLSQAGLFGTIDAGAKVEKLAVHVTTDGITSTASASPSNAGAIAAINKGTIDQCYVTGEGTILSADGSDSFAGGIAGKNEGTISNCYNLIPVKVEKGTNTYVGGIAGHNNSTIEYCFATGEVSTANQSYTDEAAGGIAGCNDESTGVVKNCVAVNSKVAATAMEKVHRVIGKGGNTDDVNNFSHQEMPLTLTRADNYNPLEGTPLTKDNLNSNAGGCFNGWDVAAWNLDNISTHLPKIQSFADTQHNKEIAPYLLYTVTIGTVTNGTLSITRPDPIGGSTPIVVSTGDQVSYDSQLTIAATPDAKYELDQLQVNGATFTNGGTHVVKDDVTISATFKKIPDPTPTPDPDPKPDPAPVYYTVTLPAVEGVVTDPVAGEYQVEAWDTFRFYLALDTAYDKSVPVITTDRNETIKPRPSDGAYLVKSVRSDVQIFIGGIVKNPSPVANESIEASRPKVWRTNNYLHMQSPTGEQAYIYTPAGKLQASCKLLPGEVKTIWLPSGIYFIRIGKERCKVTVDS